MTVTVLEVRVPSDHPATVVNRSLDTSAQTPSVARIQVIRTLLEQYPALVDPMQVRTNPGDGTGVLLMPQTWTASVKELERLLRVMRDDRATPLVQTPAGLVSVRKLWWHLNEWFLAVTVVMVRPARMPRSRGRQLKKALLTDDGKMVPVRRVLRHPDASEGLAEAGVVWLAQHWGLSHEPFLPSELMAA